MNIPTNEKLKGLVYGLAFGDAWGYTTEFVKYKEIMKYNDYNNPPCVLKVSDDTQMSIYNFHALREIKDLNLNLKNLRTDYSLQNKVRGIFADYHVEFYYDDNNDRAPGVTCMTALETFIKSERITGLEGSDANYSKGCGTIMRAPWLGAFNFSREEIVLLSIIQSQTTHGHPISWISAAVASLLSHDLLWDSELNELLTSHDPQVNVKLLSRAKDILFEIQNIPSNLTVGLEKDFAEILGKLTYLQELWSTFLDKPSDSDTTALFGEGWVADEVLYNALMVAAAYTGRAPYEGIKRLVRTNGDSDSLAAVAGSFIGAVVGYEELGYNIEDNIEPLYKEELQEIVAYLVKINS